MSRSHSFSNTTDTYHTKSDEQLQILLDKLVRIGFQGFFNDWFSVDASNALYSRLRLGSGTFGNRRLGAGHLGAWTIGRQNSAPDYCRFFLSFVFL